MFQKSLIFIVIVLTLAACSFKTHYAPMEKLGVDEMQALKDSHECKMEAADYRSKLAIGGAGGSGGFANQQAGVMVPGPGVRVARDATAQSEEFYVECMKIKGYHPVGKALTQTP